MDWAGDDPGGAGGLEARALVRRPPPDDPIALAWVDTRRRYHIPHAMPSS